jgi:DNA mismatch endonuclease (patch repair protein)
MMARVRGKDTRVELMLRRALWAKGYRYRLHASSVVGRPDLVFPRYRVAVFVDGDYWHGRALREGGEDQLHQVIRGNTFEWWRQKLAGNIDRDEHVTAALTKEGWRVLRLWESEVRRDLGEAVELVVKTLSTSGG